LLNLLLNLQFYLYRGAGRSIDYCIKMPGILPAYQVEEKSGNPVQRGHSISCHGSAGKLMFTIV